MSKTREALIVKNCKFDDFGTYQAECGTHISEATLSRTTPFASKLPDYIESYRNEIAVITADLKPGCYSNWFYENTPITADNFSILKYEIRNSGNCSQLIIKNISDRDFTFFACESRGEKKFCELREKAPFSERGLENSFGNIDGIAVFTVDTAFDCGNVNWYYENTKIEPARFSMLKYEIRNKSLQSSLIVKNIKETDFTTFACEAKGVRLSAAVLKASPFVRPCDAKVEAFATDIEVISVDVKPHTSVSWFFNGVEINSENFSILKYEERSVGNRRELIVKNISNSDVGSYSCKALGVTTGCTLRLVGLKKWTTSYMKSKMENERKLQAQLRNTTSYRGGIAVFECCTRIPELPVHWFVNGRLITKDTFSILKYEHVQSKMYPNYHRLIVKNIQVSLISKTWQVLTHIVVC